MLIEQVLLTDLVLDPANARIHADKNLEAIKGSLARFGQQKPIVVTADGVVIAGNGDGCSPQWFGPTDEKTVWELPKERINEFHPTQKPVALGERALTNSSKAGQVVLDLFLGSGSTLIACEKTGRRCFGMELDPKYCDVILTRWEQFTSKTASLITEVN